MYNNFVIVNWELYCRFHPMLIVKQGFKYWTMLHMRSFRWYYLKQDENHTEWKVSFLFDWLKSFLPKQVVQRTAARQIYKNIAVTWKFMSFRKSAWIHPWIPYSPILILHYWGCSENYEYSEYQTWSFMDMIFISISDCGNLENEFNGLSTNLSDLN